MFLFLILHISHQQPNQLNFFSKILLQSQTFEKFLIYLKQNLVLHLCSSWNPENSENHLRRKEREKECMLLQSQKFGVAKVWNVHACQRIDEKREVEEGASDHLYFEEKINLLLSLYLIPLRRLCLKNSYIGCHFFIKKGLRC